MSQVPALQFSDFSPELLANFGALAQDMFANFNNLSFRSIKPRVNGVELYYGADNTQLIPYDKAKFVCLGAAAKTHCLWYKDQYVQGKDASPALVWINKGDGNLPDALPAQARVSDQYGRKQYQTKLRSLWAFISDNSGQLNIDLDNYFIFDMPATAIYAEKEAQAVQAMTWLGVSKYCKQLSQVSRVVVHPAMFITQFVQGGMQGKVFFRFLPNNQQPKLLPQNLLQDIYTFIMQEEVQQALQVKEVLSLVEEKEDVAPRSTTIDVTPPVQYYQQPQPGNLSNLPPHESQAQEAPFQPVQAPQAQAQAPVQAPQAPQAQVPVQPVQAPQAQPVNPATDNINAVIGVVNQSQQDNITQDQFSALDGLMISRGIKK